MNIKRLFKNKCKNNIDSFKEKEINVSLSEQIKQKQDDYYKLLRYHKKDIELYCKKPIVEWDNNERTQMKKRMREYENDLCNAIEMLDRLHKLEEHYN